MKALTHNIDRLNELLQTKAFGRTCRWFDSVDSTNSLALDWARQGATSGSVVVADFQTVGRGRFSRIWHANPGENLTFSVILEAGPATRNMELLPAAAAVAVTEALAQSIEPHRPMIKWPNDVLLAGRKVCGILIESSFPAQKADGHRGHIVAGIGINVNQERFPEELRATATSIYQILGTQTDRIVLLADVLIALETAFHEVAAGRTKGLLKRYESRMVGLNKTARFSFLDTERAGEGTILGVDDAGALRLRTKKGIETLRAGEITFREDDRVGRRIASLTDRSRPASPS